MRGDDVPNALGVEYSKVQGASVQNMDSFKLKICGLEVWLLFSEMLPLALSEHIKFLQITFWDSEKSEEFIKKVGLPDSLENRVRHIAWIFPSGMDTASSLPHTSLCFIKMHSLLMVPAGAFTCR